MRVRRVMVSLSILYPTLYLSGHQLTEVSGAGTCSQKGGASGWLCQHRYPAISGMVGFRNMVGEVPMSDWVSPSTQRIAFGRGELIVLRIQFHVGWRVERGERELRLTMPRRRAWLRRYQQR